MLDAAIFVVFPLLMAVAAFSDMFSMTIPNRVSILLFVAFLAIAPFAGLAPVEIGWHVAAGAAVLVVCFGLFALNVMGGGDAKLLAASAVWFGFGIDLLGYLATVGIYGGLLTLVVLVLRANQQVFMALPLPIPLHFFNSKKGVPYAIAIGLAALTCYPDSVLMRAVLGPAG
ncbi:MAG: peptidase [Rhizobiales bacterium]|nr:peptidase [Hyphomicrobiales bacterium]MBA68114.1 peptidase [Hyphomicrobiales bacterium]|tara:strand:- start:287 stop:802 length:516 start_codon:yes stop_codon:yes gene_type:complete